MNISNVILSLKYIKTNYISVAKLSRWIMNELFSINYSDFKLEKALCKDDLLISRLLIKYIKDRRILQQYLINYCEYNPNLYHDQIRFLIDNDCEIYLYDQKFDLYWSIRTYDVDLENEYYRIVDGSLLWKWIKNTQIAT